MEKSFATKNEAVQKETLQEGPKQEALQEDPLESFNYVLSKSTKADIGPNLDQLKDDEILRHCNPWPIISITNESQNAESNVSIIEIADDLSASHSALQDAQASEAKLEEEPSASSPQYACDFNLFLEDSADNRQNFSSQSLEHVEKENSLCGSAPNSKAGFVHSKTCLSWEFSEKDDEPEEVVVKAKIRSKARRIVSDGEDEDDSFKDTSSINPFNTSLFQFSSVKQFDASTPKNDISPPGRFFSSQIPSSVNKSMNSRRSLASRRSLINMVLDHVEDMEERLDDSSEAKGPEDYPEEGVEESSGEASKYTEEDPSGETLSSENKSSWLMTSKPSALAQETSLGAPEPLSGEQLVGSPQDKAAEATNDYETLVKRGKELKECGKIQEALNCLVKALDIKSADPEVMLLTLSLYKQLNNN
nr:BJ-HCC-15 tumor antigen [Homo sapiens]BAA90952.1 unnamed protein product [Homo sapiens]